MYIILMKNNIVPKIGYRNNINLDKEYISTNVIYEQQKEYRKTPEGRIAIKRANERMLLKKMKRIGKIECVCGEQEFEVMNIYDDEVVCYNCRYRREAVLRDDEICQ